MQDWGRRLMYLDGGMGTLLQGMGLEGGLRPETWNERHPQRILDIHRQYLEAGCDVVTANTFGATRSHLGPDAPRLMRLGVRLARQAVAQAGRGVAAADMGSLGRLLAPYGDMDPQEAYAQFEEAFVAALEEGAQLLLIETMTDLGEARLCALAAREAMRRTGREVKLWVSFTFDAQGRLLTGADVETAACTLSALRVDALGLNCGLGPEAMYDNLRRLRAASGVPVFIQPNAGLPEVRGGATVFPEGPQAFARAMEPMAELGAWAVGGCCGTTPAHIEALVAHTRTQRLTPRPSPLPGRVAGRGRCLTLGQRPLIIGERLNPTGKKRLKQALAEGDMDYLMREALSQIDRGADALDINAGVPGLDEAALLEQAVRAVQSVCDAPLQLDTADAQALEAALRAYVGKPIINSVCGKQEVMDAVFPLAARYGGALVALTLDENGIPPTAAQRVAIARRILSEASRYGIAREDLLFDALTMTVATDANAARVTLETLRALKEELGVYTVLGVSNVSFGLPQRPLVNAAFIAMALEAGLDAAILNPGDDNARAAFYSACALNGRDEGCRRYLEAFAGVGQAVEPRADEDALRSAVRQGLPGEAARAARALLDAGKEPLTLVEASVMPALAEVGDGFERRTLFLPQLLQSAAAAQAAFDLIRAALPPRAAREDRRVVLATVQGDVHDIGKNIVKVMLMNYGFSVTDLGKDVPPQRVVEAARDTGAPLVGLSALMTTTVPAMAQTIRLLRRELPRVRVVVGGAVLTEAYAREIGADFYARDAMATVRVAQEVLGA